MRMLALALVLVGTCVAQARQLDLPLNNPNAVGDLKKAIKAFDEKCTNYVNVGNGECGVVSIDPDHLNLETELENAVKDLDEVRGGCSFGGTIEDNPYASTTDLDDVSQEFDALLQKIDKSGQFVGVVNVGWDGDKGDSESCSIYQTQIILKDGTVIFVNGDYTD